MSASDQASSSISSQKRSPAPQSTSMAPPPAPMMHSMNMNMRSLISPPEPPLLQSFHGPHDDSIDAAMKARLTDAPKSGSFPISPPVSPATTLGKPVGEEGPSTATVDPILYPHVGPQPSREDPLFSDSASTSTASSSTSRAVQDHVAARGQSLFREASPPREPEYVLALEFKSQVARAFSLNPRLWLERERGYLKANREARRYLTIAPARRTHAPVSTAVRKAPAAPRTPKAPRAPKPPRPTPDATKRVVREDKDFAALPDYCPPLSSLPERPNSLKVEWRGVPLDLSDDPHAAQLDPDEILLASNLRLDCATYLTSKRRIFIKRIEALRIGKEFRKTDAQQACKIDVNKASKLWQAFEKVGWLDPSWVARYV